MNQLVGFDPEEQSLKKVITLTLCQRCGEVLSNTLMRIACRNAERVTARKACGELCNALVPRRIEHSLELAGTSSWNPLVNRSLAFSFSLAFAWCVGSP